MKAAIAELERQVAAIDEAKARLDQRRDRVVAVLNDLRDLAGEGGKPSARGLTVIRGKKAPAKGLKVAAKPKAARHPQGEGVKAKKRGRLSDAVVANARTIAERDGLPAAVQRLGIPYGTLYTYAQRERWKLPDTRGRRPAPKPATPAAPLKRRAVGIECPKCHTISPENPCSCGAVKKIPA